MSWFQDRLVKIVRLVPPGYVMSYGQVALYMGMPRAARQVGWAMRSLGDTPGFPWWRIVNNSGRISIKGTEVNLPAIQRQLLAKEGIEIDDALRFDIERYRFIPNRSDFDHP